MSRFQFSIRFLLVATAVVAVGVSAVRAEPSVASYLAIGFLCIAFATVAIVGVTQTTGKRRTFWIGTAIPLVPLVFTIIDGVLFDWTRSETAQESYARA